MSGHLDLVGYHEIAQRADVARPVVTIWRGRYPDFPRPAAELRTGPVWLWADVDAWLRGTGRPPHGPRRRPPRRVYD